MASKLSFTFFIFCIFICNISFSQSETEDSIRYFQDRLMIQTTPVERAYILSRLTWFYSTKGDFDKTMQMASEAIPLLEANKRYEDIASVYGSLAQVFQFQHNAPKITYYTKKALEYMLLTKDKTHIATTTMNYGVSLADEKKYPEAFKTFEDALAMAVANKDTSNILEIYLNMASTLYEKGDFDKVLQPAMHGLELARKTKNIEAILRGEAIVGGALIREKKFDEADEHFKRAEALLPNVGSPYYDRQMAFIRKEWAFLKGDYKGAYDYLEKFYKLDTLLANTEHKERVGIVEASLRTNEKELEAVNLQSKLTRQKWFFTTGTLLLTLLVIIFYLQRKRLAQKNTLLQTEHKLSATQLALVKSELESFAEVLTEKNKTINQFEIEIKDLKLKDEDATNALLKQINEARIITDDQWLEFRLKFEKLHPQFISRLHQQIPNLTDNEMQMACMIRLNFSNNQIAGMLGISSESVIKNKYRFRKKIEHGDLNTYLSAI